MIRTELKKITNRKGIAYGLFMIRNVFNGLNENKAIENTIMELYPKYKKKLKKYLKEGIKY